MTSHLEFHCNFIDGAYLEIKGESRDKLVVEMASLDNPELSLTAELSANQWVRSPHRYFIPWRIGVFDKHGNQRLFLHEYDIKGKRVFIS
ncbi:MAG: hypothetical protein ACU841_15155, partial [Gammaproteobacteria bacterium]